MLDKLLPNSKICILSGAVQNLQLKRELWKVEPSTTAKNCKNLIREIVEGLNLQPNPEKPVIALSLGDPTIYGNLKPSAETTKAVLDVLYEGLCNGYAPSVGYEAARAAVAEYLSYDGAVYQSTDIVLCSGCSSSLDICIAALADASRGQNILIPRPGFAIYRTLAESMGVEPRYYNLNPENHWEADLEHLEAQIDQKTAAVILNNPSNPHRLPVIADEIYERLVYPGKKFISTAALSSEVPILVCGGLAKRFLVPGWRLGWIAVHDPIGAFEHIRKSLASLSQRTIGSNTLIQGAIPAILQNTPQSFHDGLAKTLALHADIAFERFSQIRGLTPFRPEGAMYMVVEISLRHFPKFTSGLDFAVQMMREESVFCLPGECFQIPGFLRIVLTVPLQSLEEACDRIEEFGHRHYVE
ncbi:hypothetical protein D910_08816 [Dendroctonus ponderosae]|uniref:Tyrosine aminotransferase n=1 Tax=Dendroctonus ponderosae TaxID=77166 RepID=U4UMU8_DENPD|nr:hypothetical protein D910_08816 [Dendroctonus ponderosae]